MVDIAAAALNLSPLMGVFFFHDLVVLLSFSFCLPGLSHLVSPCLSVTLDNLCDIFRLGLGLARCKTLSNGRYVSLSLHELEHCGSRCQRRMQ